VSRSIQHRIRDLLRDHGHLQGDLDTLADGADLYAAGLGSHATVGLMLALEEAFDIEFPERLLRRTTFASIDAIAAALTEIGVTDKAA